MEIPFHAAQFRSVMVIMRVLTFILLLSPLYAQDNPESRLRFEVASVKRSPDGPPRFVGIRSDPQSIYYSFYTLRNLVMLAYGMNANWRVIGGPKWIDGDHYDVQATLPQGTSRDQVPQMLQTLLRERFNVKAHIESRLHPVLELTVTKSGLKFKESADGDQPRDVVSVGHFDRHKITMEELANFLWRSTGTPVVDSTHLKGSYALSLTWDPTAGSTEANGAPSIYTALREQLGLELRPGTVPVDFIVISEAERPTFN